MATAENEERWLALAKALTARALSREVRAADRAATEAGPGASDEEGLEDADAFELDRRLRALVHFEQRLDAQVAPGGVCALAVLAGRKRLP